MISARCLRAHSLPLYSKLDDCLKYNYCMLCYLLNGYDVLQAIRECGCLRAPEPYACGDLALGGSYLLMEHMPFIPFGQSIPDG
jgi:hypothetical protein